MMQKSGTKVSRKLRASVNTKHRNREEPEEKRSFNLSVKKLTVKGKFHASKTERKVIHYEAHKKILHYRKNLPKNEDMILIFPQAFIQLLYK